MSDNTWLEPLDRRIEEVRRKTEAIKNATAALKRLYANNDKGMKRLADS
jgi:cation transport regulator ChaB